MLVRWLTPFIALGFVCGSEVPSLAQTAARSLPPRESFLLERLEFVGLRHLSPDAVLAQLSLRTGDAFEVAKLREDVHRLGRLGWFASIRVDELPPTTPDSASPETPKYVALRFCFEEQPLLVHIEYSGSRLLSAKQIEKLLEEKKLAPGLGRPADPSLLQRIAETLRSALAELAHPEASVRIRRQIRENATAAVRFEISDGPHLPVRWIRFNGHPHLSDKVLRAQMQTIAPGKLFASLRSKDAYSTAAFEDDRQRILTYYWNHGYPEARVGNPQLAKFVGGSWKPFPVPHSATRPGLLLSIPVEAGSFYHVDAVDATESFRHALESHTGKPLVLRAIEQDHAFSQRELDKLGRFYATTLQLQDSKSLSASFPSAEVTPIFDSEKHSVRLRLALSDSPPYVVDRLDFQGLHKFSDRYVRRRIPLREGHPFDQGALEAGLTKLARTGYFKSIRRENVHIQFDEARRTAYVVLRLEEIGQQRGSFEGGRAQFGNTLGLAYTVFDLLQCEELLTAKLDGGPQALQVVLGIAKEGIFGTRGSLALSFFDNVLRPRFIHGVQGPFPSSHSEGFHVPWTYALNNVDSVGLSYTLSRTTSDNPFGAATGSNTVPAIDLRPHTSARTLSAAWIHDSGNQRILLSSSASGDLLGGDENMLRSSVEAARLFRDPFSATNAWALRTTFMAAGSYRGDAPLYSRFFAGDEFVRGLHTGDLGPMALSERTTPFGALLSPAPAGANFIAAANAEYRIPFRGVEVAGFFDLGSGWLLPNWLGPAKPTLLSATNGVFHGAMGIELRWTIPDIQVPLRSYYALNVLRLDRIIPLSGKSLWHARNRFAAFGWGLGSLF